MNCSYCQRPCRKIIASQNPFGTYQCEYHGAVRVQFSDNPNTMNPDAHSCTILICLVKESNYQVTFFYGNHGPSHPKFSVSKLPFDPKKTSQLIFNLDFHPDITPDNIKDKLPTLLTFS